MKPSKYRIVRHLFTLCYAASLTLCVAVCVLWISGGIYYMGNRPQWSFTTDQGDFAVFRDYRRVFGVNAHWLLLIGLTLPVAHRTLARFRQLRAYVASRNCRPGFCRCCGYDLRASPERCPECGTAAEVTA